MYAAHDDLSIYGIGKTENEAMEDAREGAAGDYRVSPIDPDFAKHIQLHGFNGNFDTFDFDENGVIIP